MSIWNDIRRRGIGVDLKKEDEFPCYATFLLIGNGTKLPKQYSDLTNIRMQKFMLFISSSPMVPNIGSLIHKEYVWTYKVGERDIDKVKEMLINLKTDFGDFTYILDKDGKEKLTDKSAKIMEEFTKRIKKHNEEVCGVPLRNVSRFEDDWL